MTALDTPGVGVAARSLSDLATLVAVMARLADDAGEAGRWSEHDRRAALAQLDLVVDGLTAVRAAVLVAEREGGRWQGEGDRDFRAWRGRTCRCGPRSGAAQVRQADHLSAVPAVAAAVTAGRTSVEHAAAIGSVATHGTPAQQSAVLSPAAQEHLLEMAERSDAGAFATDVATWAATVDPAGLERDHQAQRTRRFVHVTTTKDGTLIKGRLDSMAGHRLVLAMEAVSPRPGADDDRDHGQRCADAIDAMAITILGLKDTKPGASVPTQVTMILTPETWAAARAERDRRRRAGRRHALGAGAAGHQAEDGAAVPTGDDAAREDTGQFGRSGPATLEDGTPVPGSELAVAMCDCEITRIVIDADGVPLDLGRAVRVYTGPQRRAVIARDRECAWPQCHAHARWSQIHHIRWWERDDGPTSVDNGVLLCSFHHHEVHRRDLTITRVPVRRADDGLPGVQPGDTVTRAAYEFRDQSGRQVGHMTATRSSAADPRAPGPADTGGRRVTVPSPRGRPTDPTGATDAEASGSADGGRELEWTTDPHTGMRIPALFLGT